MILAWTLKNVLSVSSSNAKGADEFVPYMCATDIPESKYGGLGLKRTKTLAEGADKCDFRYKKGPSTEIVLR